ncbi:MAG: FCD domain-containing protein [Geminicoccaceae bacterium]
MSEDDQAGAFSVTPLLRSKSSAERVVTQIIDLIRSGNVRAGDRLPSETELAKAFQVSRPVIREALRGLAILGVVETRQGGRCYVTDLTIGRLMAPLQFVIALDETNLVALHEARLLIETGLIRTAAAATEAGVLARLEEMVASGFELVGDPLGFRLLDQEFHRTLNRLGGNPFLETVAQSFYELGMEYRRIATETPGTIERSAMEHQAIVAALRAGDAEAAAASMAMHLKSIHETTLKAIRQGAPARARPRAG